MPIPKRQILELFHEVPVAYENEFFADELGAFLELLIRIIEQDDEVEHYFSQASSVVLVSGTKPVVFDQITPTLSYSITLSGDTAETFTWASKAVTGFTINSSNGSSTSNVDWIIRLHDSE